MLLNIKSGFVNNFNGFIVNSVVKYCLVGKQPLKRNGLRATMTFGSKLFHSMKVQSAHQWPVSDQNKFPLSIFSSPHTHSGLNGYAITSA